MVRQVVRRSLLHLQELLLSARRRLAANPFIYRIYARLPLVSKLDRAVLRIINRIQCSTISIHNIISEAREPLYTSIGEVHLLIDNKHYEEAIEQGVYLISRECMESSMLERLAEVMGWQNRPNLIEEHIYPAMRLIMLRMGINAPPEMEVRLHKALNALAITALENALIPTAIKFLQLTYMLSTKSCHPSFIFLLHFIQSASMEAELRGKEIRKAYGEGEINQIGSIVWGKDYIEAFMHYNVRSMLAEGNMPYLCTHGKLIHSIVTTEEGRRLIEAHPVYENLVKCAQVEFFCFPQTLLELSKGGENPDEFTYLLYGVLDHINIHFARGLRANLFMIPVDSIVANPSFRNMRRYITEGYDCCGGGNLVAGRETFLPALDKEYGNAPVITIDTRRLASLALQYPHHYITSQLIHDDNSDFGMHPRELFWPATGGIYVHSIYTHPLVISATRISSDFTLPYKWVDFLLPPRMFSRKEDFIRYKIIENAEEAYINNFAPVGRKYQTTGLQFQPELFTKVHMHSYPIHRYMLNTRQFIPCDYPVLKCSNNIDKDIEKVKKELFKHFADVQP